MSRPATSRLKVNPALGQLPVLQYCSPDQLQVDESYQRSLFVPSSQTLIRKIAVYWDWGLCQPLFVARRSDGGLYVVDGQHRLEAAKLRGDIQQLPCVISHFDSAAEEAASFVALNQQRRPLNRLQLFRAVVLGPLNPAYRYGRSIFPSRVFDPDEVSASSRTATKAARSASSSPRGRCAASRSSR
jgi:hypothetical protein